MTLRASSESRYAAAAPTSSASIVAVQRRALLDDRLHRREAGDRARGERAHRPGRDRVHADVLLPEVPGEVAHGRVERRLRDAHHVVVRHGPLAAEVGHRHDRAAAARLHERLGRARAGDERVGADVEREPEAVARRVGEAALEILGRREGDRVHEQVEPAAERLRRPRAKTRSTSSSERTSHSVTSGLDDRSASSRTFFSIRSPWNVNASCAPSSASRCAIAHAIERRFATPSTSPRLPSNRPGHGGESKTARARRPRDA